MTLSEEQRRETFESQQVWSVWVSQPEPELSTGSKAAAQAAHHIFSLMRHFWPIRAQCSGHVIRVDQSGTRTHLRPADLDQWQHGLHRILERQETRREDQASQLTSCSPPQASSCSVINRVYFVENKEAESFPWTRDKNLPGRGNIRTSELPGNNWHLLENGAPPLPPVLSHPESRAGVLCLVCSSSLSNVIRVEIYQRMRRAM